MNYLNARVEGVLEAAVKSFTELKEHVNTATKETGAHYSTFQKEVTKTIKSLDDDLSHVTVDGYNRLLDAVKQF